MTTRKKERKCLSLLFFGNDDTIVAVCACGFLKYDCSLFSLFFPEHDMIYHPYELLFTTNQAIILTLLH